MDRAKTSSPPAVQPPEGDTVRMHETVDVTKVREAPVMDMTLWDIGFDRCGVMVMREPFPEGRPSLSQMIALLKPLRFGTCYAAFALWGKNHIRTAQTFRHRGLIMRAGGVLRDQEIKGPRVSTNAAR